MKPVSRLNRGERIAFSLIILFSLAVSTYGAFLLPILQGADEDSHLDYAWSIAGAGRLLRVGEKPPTLVNPFIQVANRDVWMLAVRTDLFSVRGDTSRRMPPGYGSRRFYGMLNGQSAGLTASRARDPYLLGEYPFAWYAAVAAWMRILGHFDRRLVTLFFGARLTSVALLAVSLVAVLGILRELRLSIARRLILTAAFAFFPLTIATACYAHPENLSTALTLLVIRGALAIRREMRGGDRLRFWTATAVALGFLLVTKYHFFVAALGAIAPMLALEACALPRDRRRWARRLAILAAPSLVFACVQLWIGFARHNSLANVETRDTLWRAEGLVRFVGHEIAHAFGNIYAGGTCFRTFWGSFGWVETLVVGPRRFDSIFWKALVGCSLSVLALSAVRFGQVGSRLWKIFRRGRHRAALSLLFSDLLLSSLVIYTVLYLVLYVVTRNGFAAQGRNWFPYLLSIFWLGVGYAPRVFRRKRFRRAVSTGVLACLFAYSLALLPFEASAVRHRYYGNARGFLPVSRATPSRVSLGAPFVLRDGKR